jgi:hypothetical protein
MVDSLGVRLLTDTNDLVLLTVKIANVCLSSALVSRPRIKRSRGRRRGTWVTPEEARDMRVDVYSNVDWFRTPMAKFHLKERAGKKIRCRMGAKKTFAPDHSLSLHFQNGDTKEMVDVGDDHQ